MVLEEGLSLAVTVQRFDQETAHKAHGDTIWAAPFLPHDMDAPFDSAWGYLEGPGSLEPHSHPADEIYFIFQGRGRVVVAGEEAGVSVGDVISIPANAEHSMICDEGPLLWAAIWWHPQTS